MKHKAALVDLRWGCLKQEEGGSIVATAASKSQIITATSFSAVI